MKMKKSMLTSTLLATLLLSTSYSTLASNSIFQVAVVKGAVGTTDLTEGKVESGIKKLTSSEKTQDFYANKMNLKVSALIDDAYINMGTPKLLKEFNYWNKYFNEQ